MGQKVSDPRCRKNTTLNNNKPTREGFNFRYFNLNKKKQTKQNTTHTNTMKKSRNMMIDFLKPTYAGSTDL